MKKTVKLLLVIITAAVLLSGCGKKGGDYPAAINIGGTVFFSTDRIAECDFDENDAKYTVRYVDKGLPKKDGEANFNRETGNPYILLDESSAAVLINGEWILFEAK